MLRRWMWLVWIGCGRSGLYAPCDDPGDCSGPEGTVPVCLDKASAGLCTWACRVDDDCAFDQDDWARVCAPFESGEATYCFPACNENAADGDGDNVPDVCPEGFGCRSTGGGRDNRKICFPEDVPADDPDDPNDLDDGPNGFTTNIP